MLKARQRLGEEIGDVAFPSHVHDAKLTLADAVLKPVKPHVDTFRQARGHGFVGEADGTLVVAIDKGGLLGVAEVVQNAAFGVGDANRREETRVLCLLDGRANHRDEGGVTRHRSVDEVQRVGVETWVRGEAEEVKRAGDGTSSRP
jgi:hypothetical protein